MLDRDFVFEITEEDLIYLPAMEVIYNRKLNRIHNHDFPRNSEGKVDSDWVDSIPTVIAKYREKFKNFWKDVDCNEQIHFALRGVYSLFKDGLLSTRLESKLPHLTPL